MRPITRIALLAAVALTAGNALAQRPFYLVPGLHPGYDSLVSMRPSSMSSSGSNAAPNVGGMAWLPDGRLFIASMSSNSAGGNNANRLGVSHGYIFSGIPGATSNASVTVSQVSTGYQMPSGAVAVGDTIFVLDNEEGLTRLVPNGSSWTKTTIHKGVLGYNTGLSGSGYRSWTGGLAYKDGFLYAVVGMGLIPGGTSEFNDANLYRGKGSIYKISLNGAVVDTFAAGVRNPVSMAVGPDDQLFYTDNQGSFMPASAMFHVTQGAFFGHLKTPFDNQMRTPPAIIFPYGSSPGGGDANNPTVARVATDMLTLRNGPYKGQMLVGTNHTTGINRVFLEKVPDGAGGHVYQGALFPFSQGMGVGGNSGSGNVPTGSIPGVLPDFRTNVNRMSYGPDGHIYLGGGNSPGNNSGGSHGFDGGLQYGLARMVPTGDTTAFEMKAIRSLGPTQLEIEFTEPVEAVATSNFAVRQGISTQATTTSYGNGYSAPTNNLTVTAATLNEDKTKATLTITGLQQRPATTTPGSQQDRTWGSLVQVRVTGIAAVSGRPMWGDTAAAKRGLTGWYTLNKFGPGQDAGIVTSVARGDAKGVRSGLMFRVRADGLAVRSPVEGAWTLRTLDTRGRVLSSHSVEAGRSEYLLPPSSLSEGVTLLEAKTVDGKRFTASASRL